MRPLLLRLGRAVAVMAGISVLVFLIFFATPGADPAARIAGRGAGPETLAAVRAEFGLDQALPVQYIRLMGRLFVSRDLASYANRGQLVVPALLGAAPVTLSLVAGAAVLWGALGLAIGLAAAVLRGRALDRGVVALGLLGLEPLDEGQRAHGCRGSQHGIGCAEFLDQVLDLDDCRVGISRDRIAECRQKGDLDSEA